MKAFLTFLGGIEIEHWLRMGSTLFYMFFFKRFTIKCLRKVSYHRCLTAS